MSSPRYDPEFLRLVSECERAWTFYSATSSFDGHEDVDVDASRAALWTWHFAQVASAREAAIRECRDLCLQQEQIELAEAGRAPVGSMDRSIRGEAAVGWARAARGIASLLPPEETAP